MLIWINVRFGIKNSYMSSCTQRHQTPHYYWFLFHQDPCFIRNEWKKKKKPNLYLHKTLTGSFQGWDPPSIFISWKSLLLFLCNIADKPTNKRTRVKNTISLAELINRGLLISSSVDRRLLTMYPLTPPADRPDWRLWSSATPLWMKKDIFESQILLITRLETNSMWFICSLKRRLISSREQNRIDRLLKRHWSYALSLLLL